MSPVDHPLQDVPEPAGPAPRDPLLVRLAQAVEDETRLDGLVAAVRPVAERLVSEPRRRRLLLGQPLGHAAHPMLTDAPLGAWMSALLLDVAGGRRSRPAARRLVGIGVLTAVPTVLTGLAELAHTREEDSRVGVLHASGNAVSLVLFTASYLARRRGRHATGVLLGMAAGTAAAGGGFLGAHLAIAQNVGSRHSRFAQALPPSLLDRDTTRTGL